MCRACHVLAIALPLSLSGCVDIPGVPDKLPGTLAQLRENPGAANAGLDPLTNVPAGIVVGDVSALDGCWGRVEESETTDVETGEIVRLQALYVWRFDVAKGTLEQYMLFDNGPNGPFDNDLLYVGTTSRFEIHEQRAMLLNGIDGEAAGVRPDGRLVFDKGASIVASINETTSYPILFTVSGDTLRVVEGGYDEGPQDLVVGEREDLATVWTRLECVP